MGLTFLVPLFLAGLAALAIPLFIHLTHRERREVVVFPSLMFLRRIPFKTVRRQRIRHWLLFLLRSLAVVVLALAFARPLLEGAGAAVADLARAREVVIAVDNSFSMGYGDRWSRAQAAARAAVGALGPEDRASVVAFADKADVVAPRSSDPVALRAAIDRLAVGAGGTQYTPAIRLAEQILEESELVRKAVVLITDFQRVGWNRDEDLRLPPGTELTRIDLSEQDATNVAVAGVTLDRVAVGERQRVTVAARVLNLGTSRQDDVDVNFAIDGQVLQSQSVDLVANASTTVRFTEVPVPPRLTRGTVTAGSDRLEADNAFRFVLAPLEPISVLVVEHPNAGPRASLYLRRALELGNEPAFDVTVRSSGRLRSADLTGRALVILNDAPPGRSVAAALLGYVTNGGSIMVALGRRSPIGAWHASLRPLLPARVGSPVDRLTDVSGSLSVIDYDHPIFDVFSQPRSGDLSEARFARYRQVSDSGATVLARYDDGAVALAERRVGAGRVLVWTSDLGNFWNDLPLQPVFLPFVHRVVSYLADHAEPQPWYMAGQVLDLVGSKEFAERLLLDEDAADARESELVVDAPGGTRFVHRVTAASPYLPLEEQGFYQIRRLDDESGAPTMIAVNVNPVESDLTALDSEELAVALTTGAPAAHMAGVAPELSPDDRERRQGAWWYLLLALVIILAAETVVANRVEHAR